MLGYGDRIGVAVSGGADSVVLLQVLFELTRDSGQALTVIHFNHKQRGTESDEDEEFVRSLASKLQLSFELGTVPLPPAFSGTVPEMRGNLEQELRRQRQMFYRACLKKLGLQRIALGHTQSDQAETVLFRILRGTGRTGLGGMAAVTRGGLIRPLLFESRTAIRIWAHEAGLTWREDRTNQDVRFRRNHLRLVTLPALQTAYNPNLEAVLARVAQYARDEDDWLNCKTKSLFRKMAVRDRLGLTLPMPKLLQLHVALQRRVLRRAIKTVKGSLRSIDSAHVEAIRNICRSESSHDRVMLPGVDAMRSYETVLLAPPLALSSPREFEREITLGEEVSLPLRGLRFRIQAASRVEQNCVTVKVDEQKSRDNYVDREALERCGQGQALRVRNWEPGDQLQPLGSSRPVKIKSLFQENRILLWERRSWPVLLAGNQIVWAYRFGIDSRFSPRRGANDVLEIETF